MSTVWDMGYSLALIVLPTDATENLWLICLVGKNAGGIVSDSAMLHLSTVCLKYSGNWSFLFLLCWTLLEITHDRSIALFFDLLLTTTGSAENVTLEWRRGVEETHVWSWNCNSLWSVCCANTTRPLNQKSVITHAAPRTTDLQTSYATQGSKELCFGYVPRHVKLPQCSLACLLGNQTPPSAVAPILAKDWFGQPNNSSPRHPFKIDVTSDFSRCLCWCRQHAWICSCLQS